MQWELIVITVIQKYKHLEQIGDDYFLEHIYAFSQKNKISILVLHALIKCYAFFLLIIKTLFYSHHIHIYIKKQTMTVDNQLS